MQGLKTCATQTPFPRKTLRDMKLENQGKYPGRGRKQTPSYSQKNQLLEGHLEGEFVFECLKGDLHHCGEFGVRLVINTQKTNQSKPKIIVN